MRNKEANSRTTEMKSKYLKMFNDLIADLSKSNSGQMMKELPENKSNKYGMGPWKWLPNCSDFKVELEGYDPLYEMHGIKKRWRTRKWHKAFRNNQMNRYLRHQFNRLKIAREERNHKKYWVIGNQLLGRSTTFGLQSIHHVYPRYHRTLPYKVVLQLIWGMHRIGQGNSKKLDFKRVYIPKTATGGKITADKGYRPLGVPTPEWRIYLHQLNNLLIYWLEGKMHINQHGFLPGRGTLTAWRDVLTKAIRKPDIYEYDYKGFFNKIRTERVLRILRDYGLPQTMEHQLEEIIRASPRLPEEKLTPENNAETKKEYEELQNSMWTMIRQVIGKETGLTPSAEEEHNKKFSGGGMEGLATTWLDRMTSLSKETKNEWLEGVPQGAAISPLLAIIPLSHLDKNGQ